MSIRHEVGLKDRSPSIRSLCRGRAKSPFLLINDFRWEWCKIHVCCLHCSVAVVLPTCWAVTHS
jgi:hypothetical protein